MFVLPYLLWMVLVFGRRFYAYAQRHTGFTAKQAYEACHLTLDRVVVAAWTLVPNAASLPAISWDRFTVSAAGILVTRAEVPGHALVPFTSWDNVSGVGLEMRPLYHYAPATRSFWHIATRVNTGYQFNILIVMFKGETIAISIPLRENDAAVQFAAHILALARTRERRLSLMGFDKSITRDIVHLGAF